MQGFYFQFPEETENTQSPAANKIGTANILSPKFNGNHDVRSNEKPLTKLSFMFR